MRGAGATIFAEMIVFIIQFVGAIILARLLTPDDFGLIAMVTTFSMLLQNFGLNGFTEAVIQKDGLTHKMMSTLFWLNASVSFGLMLLFMTSSPLIAWFYGDSRLVIISIVIGCSIFATGLSTLHLATLRRNMQFFSTSAIGITARVSSVLVAILLAWTGWGYRALIVQTVAYPLISAILAWVFCRWRPGLPSSIKDISTMLTFALHTYGNFALNYFARNIDKLLVGWKYGTQPLGLYKRAYDLFSLPANQLIVPISNVALATLSRLVSEPDKYRHYYFNALSTIAFIGMAISLILTLTGYDLVLFLLGPQWERAGIIFCYFGTSIGIMLIHGTQGWLHLSLGKPNRWVRWSIVETIFTTIFFIGGLYFGIAGVAIAYSLTFYLLVIPTLVFAGKPVNISAYAIISRIWRYFLAAVIAGLISFAVLYKIDFISLQFSALYILLRIIISASLNLLFYLILVAVVHQSLNPLKQALSIAKQMLPGRNK